MSSTTICKPCREKSISHFCQSCLTWHKKIRSTEKKRKKIIDKLNNLHGVLEMTVCIEKRASITSEYNTLVNSIKKYDAYLKEQHLAYIDMTETQHNNWLREECIRKERERNFVDLTNL